MRSRKDDGGSIDISPLIDVVFILLIFFMVTTTFVKDMKLDLERPSARSSTRASTKAIRVYVDRGERVYIDEVPVKPWMVESRVRELLAGQDEPTVVVVTDRRVPAETLIEVVDRCRLAGAQNVGVITDAEEG
ncbi:MAG: biopolymer transporter ExbD [Alphaproteobacteria bacterium]|nr:biopolymer transporter ExbD [Alphaproteobacteria bacterium]